MLCPPHLAEQWQAELRDKFHLDAELVLAGDRRAGSSAASASASRSSSVYDHVIVSTDFIKAERRRDDFLRACPELVIVDEAHTCAVRRRPARGRHQRHELLQALGSRRAPAPDPRHRDPAQRQGGRVPRRCSALLDPSLRDLPDDLSGAHERAASAAGSPATSSSAAAATSARYLDTDTPFPEREQADATYDAHARVPAAVRPGARLRARDVATRPKATGAASACAGGRRSACCARSARARPPRPRRCATAPTNADADDGRGGRRARPPRRPRPEPATRAPRASTSRPAPTTERGRRPRAAEPTRGCCELAARGRRAQPASTTRSCRRRSSSSRSSSATATTRSSSAASSRPPTTSRAPARRARRATSRSWRSPARSRRPSARSASPQLGDARAGGCSSRPTACSEGINLQEHFDAVVHYDLVVEPDPARAARGPRRPLRPARADRCAWSPSTARTTPIDGIVLDVLLRKHQRIRKSLGVAVPVPADSAAVIDAILEGLITPRPRRRGGVRAALARHRRGRRAARPASSTTSGRAPPSARSARAPCSPSTRSSPTRSTASCSPTRDAIGAGVDVRRFVTDALRAYGATVARRPHAAASSRTSTRRPRGAPRGDRARAPADFSARDRPRRRADARADPPGRPGARRARARHRARPATRSARSRRAAA